MLVPAVPGSGCVKSEDGPGPTVGDTFRYPDPLIPVPGAPLPAA